MDYNSGVAKWSSLAVLSLALAIIIIDTTILNVSISTIIHDLHTNIESLQWVITGYALVLSALTITGGRLGDLFGRKKMFMLGAIIFAIGSFIASISNNVSTLVWGEAIIEGIGASLMLPATTSLLVSTFRGKERGIAFGVWGSVAGASSAIGPIIGGYLTTHYTWRYGFRVNIFVVLVLLLGSFLIQESAERLKNIQFDWIGLILSALGLSSVVFGIIESTDYGFWKAKAIFSIFSHTINTGYLSISPYAIIIGIIICALFVWWESYFEKIGHIPLMSVKLFENEQFTSGLATTAMMSLSLTGLIFILPVFWQAVRGLDAFHTGIASLPLSLGAFVGGPLAAVLARKIKPKYVIQGGLIIEMIGGFLMHREITTIVNPSGLIWGLTAFGLGLGFVISPISNITLSAVSVEKAGEASGVNNTFRQIGTSLGTAILGAILLSSIGIYAQNRIVDSTVIPYQAKSAIIQNVTANVSSIEFSGQSIGGNAAATPAVKSEIQSIVTNAIVDANKLTIYYTILTIFIALLVSLYLPDEVTEIGHNETGAVSQEGTAAVPAGH